MIHKLENGLIEKGLLIKFKVLGITMTSLTFPLFTSNLLLILILLSHVIFIADSL